MWKRGLIAACTMALVVLGWLGARSADQIFTNSGYILTGKASQRTEALEPTGSTDEMGIQAASDSPELTGRRPYDPMNFPPRVLYAEPAVCEEREPDLNAEWIGDPRWMRGIAIVGGETFYNSLGKATHWTTGSSALPSDFVPVEIRFDGDSTLCQVFRIEQVFNAGGVGVFPGTAWDISDALNPRRLNVCFSEYNDGGGPIPPIDSVWNPDTTIGSPGYAKKEFLYIMNSSYDGTGLTYAGTNMLNDELDVLYGWYPRVEPGHTLLESTPATIRIELLEDFIDQPFVIPDDQLLNVTFAYCGSGSQTGFRLLRDTFDPPTTEIAVLGPDDRSYTDSNLTNGITYFYKIEILGPGGALLGASDAFWGTPQIVRENVELVGHWNGLSDYGDIWGYVDPNTQKEYALICSRSSGVAIIDIDDMSQTAFVPTFDFDCKDVKVYEHYMIILHESGPMYVYDINDPTNPSFVTYVWTYDGNAHNCMVDGDYLYVCGQYGGGFEIYDLSVLPATPPEVVFWGSPYVHDFGIHNDTLYCANIYGQGVEIYDVTFKFFPQFLGNFNYPVSGAHNAEISEDGNYAFIGDEIGAGNWTRVFDVSDPANVYKVADINTGVPGSVVHNCYHVGNVLYIAHYGLGLRVWNVGNPTAPYEIGYYDTRLGSDAGLNGAWSVYPFFPSGRLIVSDMVSGLYVLNFTGTVEPPCECPCQGDPVCDTLINVFDVIACVDEAFRDGPSIIDAQCSHISRNDANCDCIVSVFDVINLVDHAFRGVETLFCNPCNTPCP